MKWRALLLLPLLLVSVQAEAQSRPVLKRAHRALDANPDVERARAVFEELSNALRSEPDLATARGWWLRGDAAARIALEDDHPTTLAAIAFDSYHEALGMGLRNPSVAAFDQLEARLLPLARDQKGQSTGDRYEAASQLLVAGDLRSRIAKMTGESVDEVMQARVRTLAVQAALADANTRVARKLFHELDELGGFNEPLALEISHRVEEEQGPQQAFLFLNRLLERHANRRKLLLRYTSLCVSKGWKVETRDGLDLAMPFMKDTYDDHLFLGKTFEHLGDADNALRHVKRARAKAPKSFEANIAYARLMEQTVPAPPTDVDDGTNNMPEVNQQRLRAALKALDTALSSNPANVPALELTAKIQTRLQDEAGLSQTRQRLGAAQEGTATVVDP